MFSVWFSWEHLEIWFGTHTAKKKKLRQHKIKATSFSRFLSFLNFLF